MQIMLEDAARLQDCTEITIFHDGTYRLEKKPTCIELDDDDRDDKGQKGDESANDPKIKPWNILFTHHSRAPS